MKTKGPHSDALRRDSSRLIGGEKVKTEPEDLLASSSDNVSKAVKYASDYEIPVTARGAGSGLSGGATPCTAGAYWIPSI